MAEDLGLRPESSGLRTLEEAVFGGMGRHPEENAACGPKGGVVFEGAHLSLGLRMSSTAPSWVDGTRPHSLLPRVTGPQEAARATRTLDFFGSVPAPDLE